MRLTARALAKAHIARCGVTYITQKDGSLASGSREDRHAGVSLFTFNCSSRS